VADASRRGARDRPAAPTAQDGRGGNSIVGRLLARFYLRFHIALLLLWSFAAGLLVTKLLLWAGVHAMLWRYPLALLASYAAFFAGVRLWLAYVGAAPLTARHGERSSFSEIVDTGQLDLGSWRSSGSGGSLRGGGGDFGGGGASGSFAGESFPLRSGPWFFGGSGAHASGGGGGGGLDLDLGDGDGWLVVVLLVLVAVLLSSVLGAVIYLVYSAPTVLTEVAFQAMLAGGMIKSTQRWRDASWEMSLLKATWIPFTIVIVLALATAGLASHLFPGAHTLADVMRAARGQLG